MRLRRAPFFGLLFVASCESAAAPPAAYLLQWKLAPGDVLRVELKQHQIGEAAADTPDTLPRALESRLEAHCDIRVVAEARPGEFSLELVPILLAITGQVGAVRMDVEYRDGHWVKETIEGELGRGDPKQILAQYKQTLLRPTPGLARPYAFKPTNPEDASFLSGLYRVFPALPRAPIAVHASWFEEGPLGTFANTTGVGLAQMKNTIASIQTVEGSIWATIETVVDHTMAEKGKTIRAQRSRTARFDVADGCYRSISDHFTLTGGGWNMRVLADVRAFRLRK